MDANPSDDEPTAVVLPFKKPEPKSATKAPSSIRLDRVQATGHRLHQMYGLLDKCMCINCRIDRDFKRGRYAQKGR